MEMFVSVARLVRISSYNNDDMKITPWFHFMSSDFHVVATNAQSGGCYLQGFNVCGICRPHIKTLHEGLKHPLFVRKRRKLWKVLVQVTQTTHPSRETHLPLNGHCGYVLKHDELHLSVARRQRQQWDCSRLRGGNRHYIFPVIPVASQESNQWLGNHVDFMFWG